MQNPSLENQPFLTDSMGVKLCFWLKLRSFFLLHLDYDIVGKTELLQRPRFFQIACGVQDNLWQP